MTMASIKNHPQSGDMGMPCSMNKPIGLKTHLIDHAAVNILKNADDQSLNKFETINMHLQ